MAELSGSHTLVLNKFNVVARHLLLVTREFESQDDPVNALDYRHMLQVFACFPEATPPLAFYNFGPHSGKSQPHKHLQILPMPLAPSLIGAASQQSRALLSEEESAAALLEGAPSPDLLTRRFPLAAQVEEGVRASRSAGGALVSGVDGLPFLCFLAAMPEGAGEAGGEAGEALGRRLEAHYAAAKREAMARHEIAEGEWSYNLLVTREWWMLVPRSRDSFGPIGINAMGFAGTFLLRTNEELDFVTRQANPMDILANVAIKTEK